MSKPKLILFDFGGVLINYSKSFQTASLEQGIPIEYLDKAFDEKEEDITLGNVFPQDIYITALKENSIEADENYDFLESWIKDYEIIRPAFNLLLELSKKYSVGILSNTYKGVINKTIEMGKLPDIKYRYIFESCEIGHKKPDIEIYEYVEEETGLKGKEILFIDDRKDFTDIANHIAWGTFHFDNSNPISSLSKFLEYLDSL
jgi:putative hydrolase of the HAD superfamily